MNNAPSEVEIIPAPVTPAEPDYPETVEIKPEISAILRDYYEKASQAAQEADRHGKNFQDFVMYAKTKLNIPPTIPYGLTEGFTKFVRVRPAQLAPNVIQSTEQPETAVTEATIPESNNDQEHDGA